MCVAIWSMSRCNMFICLKEKLFWLCLIIFLSKRRWTILRPDWRPRTKVTIHPCARLNRFIFVQQTIKHLSEWPLSRLSCLLWFCFSWHPDSSCGCFSFHRPMNNYAHGAKWAFMRPCARLNPFRFVQRTIKHCKCNFTAVCLWKQYSPLPISRNFKNLYGLCSKLDIDKTEKLLCLLIFIIRVHWRMKTGTFIGIYW